MAGNAAPPIGRILETALYVDDVEAALAFYDRLFGFPHLFSNDSLTALDVGGTGVLLLFKRGASARDQSLPGGVIPAHDASGKIHLAFPIEKDALDAWETRLTREGVAVEGRVDWPKGGRSLYFRDPDGNLLELATPGLWTTY